MLSVDNHKSLTDHGDLRLSYAHFIYGKIRNLQGHGRAGKKELEAAVEIKQSHMGHVHEALLSELETLGDTLYALGNTDQSLGVYRKIFEACLILYGEHDALTNEWRNRVMRVYQYMAAVNEKHRQEQLQQQKSRQEHERKQRQHQEL